MIADNYILEKNRMDDLENQFSEKKIYEINDTNNGNYGDGKIKYQLSQVFNLNSLMNFKDGVLMIPLVIDFRLTVPTGAVTLTPEMVRKLVSIKSGSLISGVRMRINGESVVSYDSNLNELIEFDFLTKCIVGNTKEWKNSCHSYLSEQYVSISTPEDRITYQKRYDNNALVTSFENDLNIENNENLVRRDGLYEKLNSVGNLQLERQNYVENMNVPVGAIQSTRLYFYYIIKLGQIHNIFTEMNISRAFVDFDLDINLGTSTISAASLTTTYRLNECVLSHINNFKNTTSSIYFNLDGVRPTALNNAWWKSGGIPAAETINMSATISVDASVGTKLSIPIYKLKPQFNELYLKDAMRTLKFNDYLYYNLNNINTGSAVNFTISNAVSNCKYLLMVPQIVNNKLNALNQSVLLNGPLVLSNLQLIKGSSVFNSPLVYTYDMFVNYIKGLNNMNGGEDWVNSLFSLNDFNKIYRLYFFDLTLINNEKDVAYNLSVQFINKTLKSINVDFYVFEEKELMFNKLNGRIGKLN